MASSFEKSVKGATKIKLAPPKTKYIEHILVATHAGEAGVGEVCRALQYRIQDSTWTVVFKSLIVVHLMIREGSPDVTLSYVSRHRNILLLSSMSEAQTQGRNIRHYATYLSERARAYRDTKTDWGRVKESRLERLTVDKGLLRETEVVQRQLSALLKCDVLSTDNGNDITVFVFRLLVLDLLTLFQVLNQAMINILGHFFEMSKVDAQRALEIYTNFTHQTDSVVHYLATARQYEHVTRVEVPKLKHAPVTLGRQLQEYLKDPDFEVHRRQYLAELEAKKNGGVLSTLAESNGGKVKAMTTSSTAPPKTEPTQAKPTAAKPKGPDQNLIDFFDAIDQNQTPMASQPQQQQQQQLFAMQTGVNPFGAPVGGMFPVQQMGAIPQQDGFQAQQTGFPASNPFQMQATGVASGQQMQSPQLPQQLQQQPPQQPLQTAYTGMGFGGFTPQQQQQGPLFQATTLAPVPQNSMATFSTQAQTPSPVSTASPMGHKTTNPFRLSMMATGMGPSAGLTTPPPLMPQQTSSNPFARDSPQAVQAFSAPSASGPTPAPLIAIKTGTNPFAKDYGAVQQQRPHTAGGISNGTPTMPIPPASLMPQPTGSTNPFRQSAFIDQNTGMGWQNNKPAGSLLEQMETVPVFPRPAQQAPW